ncbi:MAG: hypothetical protein JST70_05770 [Bacteroidetes bacterium]|nr:hypothetical protein [Bacteroidota bacterium]
MKTKKTLAPTFTIMSRESYNETLEGLSFEEYLQKRRRDPLVERILAEMSPEDRDFNDKIQYLIEAVKDLSTKKKEILELWDICNRLIVARESHLHKLIELDLYPLVSITVEVKFSHEDKRKIDDTLVTAVKRYFDKLLKSNHPFVNKIAELNYWFRMHNQFLAGMELTNQVGTFKWLQSIFESNVTDFETLKSISPITYINYVEVLKSMYKSSKEDYKVQLKPYYRKKCLEQIVVARNAGLYDGYDQLLKDYYTISLEDRPKLNWCFDKLTGYGERPWRLVWLFLGVNIFFAIFFTLLPFEFKGIPNGWVEKFFTFMYFDNTTMLTVGYGDIYPKGIGARLAVALLQISGFAISGTAIALFLRRLLRF